METEDKKCPECGLDRAWEPCYPQCCAGYWFCTNPQCLCFDEEMTALRQKAEHIIGVRPL